ncbi:hypothetical protein ES708_24571 [subsurface metagenome]
MHVASLLFFNARRSTYDSSVSMFALRGITFYLGRTELEFDCRLLDGRLLTINEFIKFQDNERN